MGRLNNSELDFFHANRKKVMMELLKGKQFATQLQTLLSTNKFVQENGVNVVSSANELSLQISRSFTAALAAVSRCGSASGSGDQIDAVDRGGSASSEKKPAVVVKERRGCYKRRRSLDSWVTVSSTMEDGCAWRKYGQKDILSSKYPRCYYRCTHKHDGCKATKQVQRVKEDPIMYQTTYFNHHTCTETLRPHHLIVESDPIEPNLICFQSNNQLQNDQFSPNPMMISSNAAVKEEPKEDKYAQSDDVSEAKSTLQDPWEDIVNTGLETFGYKPEWAPMMSSYQQDDQVASGFDQSCESTSLHGLDMEVNQLGDIDYLHYFD